MQRRPQRLLAVVARRDPSPLLGRRVFGVVSARGMPLLQLHLRRPPRAARQLLARPPRRLSCLRYSARPASRSAGFCPARAHGRLGLLYQLLPARRPQARHHQDGLDLPHHPCIPGARFGMAQLGQAAFAQGVGQTGASRRQPAGTPLLAKLRRDSQRRFGRVETRRALSSGRPAMSAAPELSIRSRVGTVLSTIATSDMAPGRCGASSSSRGDMCVGSAERGRRGTWEAPASCWVGDEDLWSECLALCRLAKLAWGVVSCTRVWQQCGPCSHAEAQSWYSWSPCDLRKRHHLQERQQQRAPEPLHVGALPEAGLNLRGRGDAS